MIGTVIFGDVLFFHHPSGKNTVNSEILCEWRYALPRVDIVYACADMSTDLIDIMVKAERKVLSSQVLVMEI
jgi:hypothetical protein